MKIDSAIARWRAARYITLGAIVVAGTMSTAAAVTQMLVCDQMHQGPPVRSYSKYEGIGVELDREGDTFVVDHVFPGTPAQGKLHAGAVLLSVDGESPEHMQGWSKRIRGEAGTTVELEVMYPDAPYPSKSRPHTVVIERSVIRLGTR